VLNHKTRAIGYEHIRGLFIGNTPKDQAPLWAKMAAGMSAGAIGQAIAVPLDLIKVQPAAQHYSIYPSPRLILLAIAALIFVRYFFPALLCACVDGGRLCKWVSRQAQVRMQADGRMVASGQMAAPRYRGLADAFTAIAQTEGAAGFYRGCWPAIQRAALVNLGELTTYDTAKKHLVGKLGDSTLCHVSAAVCSGFVASLCSTPADVAKSRIMGQVPLPDGSLPYYGTLDCWRKVRRCCDFARVLLIY
jgi:solute carrier family 25 uncoupling protein 27